MEVGCEIEESFQDTMRRLEALEYSFEKNEVLEKCLVLCNTSKDLLRMRLDPPWGPVKLIR